MHCENGVVVWDDDTISGLHVRFPDLFPEGVEIDVDRMKYLFRLATYTPPNKPCACVSCEIRIDVYYLIMAHEHFLSKRGAGVTGQLTSATQGSVSMGMSQIEKESVPAPWNGSNYGIMAWMLTDDCRHFRYYPDRYRWQYRNPRYQRIY